MTTQRSSAYRQLMAAVAFFLITHALGLISMGAWLLPGFDPARSAAARAEYLRNHALIWQWAWLPWQLSAASDAWLTLALARWSRALALPRTAAWSLTAAACFALAVVPEQYAEWQLAHRDDTAHFARYLWLTGTWANSAYVLMTACWMRMLRQAGKGAWPPWAELSLLGLFGAAGLANHFAWSGSPNVAAFRVSSGFNGVAFPALLVYGAAIAVRAGELQLMAANASVRLLRWPRALPAWSQALVRAAGSPGLRDLVRTLQRLLPFPVLRSDVRDVLYLNWLVPADALEALLPSGTRVQRFGEHSLFSVLVFRHGHFGPSALGRARALLPSPLQCNVRAYLEQPPQHVMFLANSIDHAAYCLGARLLSDGLCADYPAHTSFVRSRAMLAVDIDASAGSALALHARVTEASAAPAIVLETFGDAEAALRYIVPQNMAVRRLPTIAATCESAIVVEAALESARWAEVNEVRIGEPFAALIGQAPPFAFVLANVRFEVVTEHLSTV